VFVKVITKKQFFKQQGKKKRYLTEVARSLFYPKVLLLSAAKSVTVCFLERIIINKSILSDQVLVNGVNGATVETYIQRKIILVQCAH
jgi:hypothetical protein